MIASPVAVPPLGREAVERGLDVVALGRRALQHARAAVERHDADVDAARHAVDEVPGGAAGGHEARGLDVGRLHRAGHVGREHDRRALDRHRDRLLRLGRRDDEHGEREQEGEHRRVAAPAGPARRDRGEQRRARRTRPPRGAGGAAGGRTRRSPPGTRTSAARTSGAPKLIASAPAGGRQRPRSSNDALSRTLPRPLAQFDVEGDRLAVALDLHGHDVAGGLALDAGRDVGRVVDAPSVDGDDDVAGLDAAARAGAAGRTERTTAPSAAVGEARPVIDAEVRAARSSGPA